MARTALGGPVRAPRRWLTALMLAGAGCVSAPKPSAAYFGPIVGPARPIAELDVFQAGPRAPFEDVGRVDVRCPTIAVTEASPAGGVSRLEGGCSYPDALLRAQRAIAAAGADGLYHVETAAAANGQIVSLSATVFRYADPEVAGAGDPPSRSSSMPGDEPRTTGTSTHPKAPLDAEQRLRRLHRLRAEGLIDEGDFERKKSEILRDL